jgi:hypothetical protein
MGPKPRIECPKCGERALGDVYIVSETNRDGASEEECGFNDGDLILEFECGLLGRISELGEIEEFGSCLKRYIERAKEPRFR